MAELDTVKLLRECDAGIKMGVSSIDEALDYVNDGILEQILTDSKNEHSQLQNEAQSLLANYNDDGKEPNPIAKGMSWIKTNAKLTVRESDSTVADLITEGCDMGVKSLNRYLNEYQTADEKSKNLTNRLIQVEDKLAKDVRAFL